ncbi:MAG: polymer-forming cytoskeletal protein [Kiritimatiellales bacterium]|nr:polymer-forming cytoskeletal protein [Kiritimatiellota bacterium]MBL7011887.1 polymer-forming cytoskeletal protein [Kiritimatiellales bacterium]
MSKVHSLLLRVLIVLLLNVFSAQAIEFIQTNQFVITEMESMPEESWISAQSLTINGSVSNDLFASAPVMELNGTFHGDAWCAGNSITGAGIFLNSARLISRITQIQGTHYGSVTAVGTTVKIDRTAVLYSDLLCVGENVILEGSVSGKVRVLAQRVTLGGQIKGDTSITAQEIVILPGTVINGNLSYQAPNELVLSPSVILNGELQRRFSPAPVRRLMKKNLGGHFMFALAALVTGLVFIGLFPRYNGTALHLLSESRGLCSLAGFAGLVLLPMGAFVLLLTVVALPLSILILLFYFILLYLSKIAVALWIGSAVLRRREFNKQKIAAPLTLGLLILYALTSFTAAEMIVNILVIILGLGALLIALFKKPVLIIQAPNAINEINKEG